MQFITQAKQSTTLVAEFKAYSLEEKKNRPIIRR